jgi:hypothetical protein
MHIVQRTHNNEAFAAHMQNIALRNPPPVRANEATSVSLELPLAVCGVVIGFLVS